MTDLAKRGTTLIVISHDPAVVKGATVTLDLNVKPVPRITTAPRPVDAAAEPVADKGRAS